MRGARIPLARMKSPPAYNAGPLPSSKTVRERTVPSTPLPGAPKADQLVPSHLAIFGAEKPPAVVKRPPAYNAGPDPSSKTARALTKPFIPLSGAPRADQ